MSDDTTGHRSHRDLARERVDRVNERAGRNLPAAVGVAVGLIGYVIVTLLFFKAGFMLLLAVGMVLGSIELHRVLRAQAQMTSAVLPICIGTVAMVAGSYLAHEGETLFTPTTVLIIALGVTVLAALAWRLPGGSTGFVRDVAASMLTIAYIPLLGSFLALMVGTPNGGSRITTTILCVAASDTGGWLAGVLFGRHPLAPRISPKKTWEGSIGSLLLSLAVGAVMAHQVLRIPVGLGLVFGAAMVVFGTLGDLVESQLKRDLGIKDMSHFLPGHGGVLDRVDSLLFAAPVAWGLLHLMVPGG